MSNVFITGRLNPQKLVALGEQIAALKPKIAQAKIAQRRWEHQYEELSTLVLKALITSPEFKAFGNAETRKIMMQAAVSVDPETAKASEQVENWTAQVVKLEADLEALIAERRGIETALYFDTPADKKPLEQLNNEIYGKAE